MDLAQFGHQRGLFFTDGFYHRHFTPAELRRLHGDIGLTPTRVSITHMAKQMAPGVPRAVGERLKRLAGWLLVVEATK